YVALLRPAKAVGEAINVSIDNNAHTDMKSVAKYHIGRLASDSRQFNHLFHRLRHFAMIVSHDIPAGGANILCFIAEKGYRFDILLKLFLAGVGVVFGAAILLKKLG